MEVVVGGKYRHFKGNCYKVLLIALDSESNHEEAPKRVVVYQALYGDNKIWARPYEMFISKVDREKYPDVTQEYRFQYIGDCE